MLRQVFRLVVIGGALVWLLAAERAPTVHAAIANCNCHGVNDGWKFVLVNPHCGHGTGDAWSDQYDNYSCESWCRNLAENTGRQQCGHICDQEGSEEYGWTASTWSYEACWTNYDTYNSGCFSSWGGC